MSKFQLDIKKPINLLWCRKPHDVLNLHRKQNRNVKEDNLIIWPEQIQTVSSEELAKFGQWNVKTQISQVNFKVVRTEANY